LSKDVNLNISSQWRGVRILACGIAALAIGSGFHAIGSTFLEDMQEIEDEHASLCPVRVPGTPLVPLVSAWAAAVRETIPPDADPRETIDTLNRFLFDRQAIRSSQDLHDPCNLLPSAVAERKQGYCVGLAALYLALAQRLELPIFAVATPTHVFLRYDDGTTRINIETADAGAMRSDEAYARDGKIPEIALRHHVFLRNLSSDEFLAQVHNDLGAIYSKRGEYARAAEEYESALGLDRRLPAAWYNLGLDRLRSGDYPRAIRVFTRSLDLLPTDVGALNNRGFAWMKRGRCAKARDDFEAALRLDPSFEPARKNLSVCADSCR